MWVNTPYRDRYADPSGSWAGAGNLEHPFREGTDKDGKGDENDGQKKKKKQQRDSRPGLSRAQSTFLPAVTAITASRKIAGSFRREPTSLPNRIQEEGEDNEEGAETQTSVQNGSNLSSSSSSSQAQQSIPPAQGGLGAGNMKNALLPMIPRWDLGKVDGKPMGEARLICGTLPNPASGSWKNSSSLSRTIKKGRILRGAMTLSSYRSFIGSDCARSLP